MAMPNCPVCGGDGSRAIPREDGSIDYRLCLCVVRNQRLTAARVMIEKRLPPLMRRMTFDTYEDGGRPENQMALNVARNFCDQWEKARTEGWILGLWGDPGCGKTHLATAMSIDLTRRYLAKILVESVPRLLAEQRRTFSAGTADSGATPIERAIAADFLVLDDLGAEYLRSREGGRSEVDWVTEQLYLLLDERLRNDRPTVYTTNLSPADLANVLTGRVASRIERAEVMPALEVTRVADRARRDGAAQELLIAPRKATR